MLILDTGVLFDVLRDHPGAKAWLAKHARRRVVVPGHAALQLLDEAKDGQFVRHVRLVIPRFAVKWPSRAACEEAMRLFPEIRVRHGLSLIEALIGLTAREANHPLLTFNRKFRGALPGLEVSEPDYRSEE